MRCEYPWDPLSVDAMNDVNVCIYHVYMFMLVQPCWICLFPRSSIDSCTFLQCSAYCGLLVTYSQAQAAVHHTFNETSFQLMKGQSWACPIAKTHIYCLHINKRSSLFWRHAFLRGPCLALEKVKLYQIKPTQSHVCFFFKRKSLKSNRLLSWLFSTTLAKWWKWMGSMASFTWG